MKNYEMKEKDESAENNKIKIAKALIKGLALLTIAFFTLIFSGIVFFVIAFSVL